MQWSGYTTDSGDRGLALRLLGPFSATRDGMDLPALRTYKGRWLLALLALRAGRPVERGWLASTLWPESRDDQASYNLRRCLSELRAALGEEAERIESPTAHTLRLNLQGAFCDVLRFDEAVRPPADPLRLAKAVELYSGPLLEGCDEEWARVEREPRAEDFRRALETLANAASNRGDRHTAAGYLRRLLLNDPLREDALRALMLLLAEAGDMTAALETYRAHRLMVRDTFQNDLSPETKDLYATLQKQASRPPSPRNPVLIPPKPTEPVISLPPESGPSGPPGFPAFDPEEGALPPDSPRYIERETDAFFMQAIARRDSIVLLKGARQTGKTSLLARGLRQARAAQCRVVITDFQRFTREQMISTDTLLRALAEHLCDNLELDITPTPEFGWRPEVSPNDNFERFLRRRILKTLGIPLVWALDEVDRLFSYAYRDDIFGMFRAWHNERALDPDAPWHQLTLAIAYATESHLLVTDFNQSPFNVGTRLALADFTLAETHLLHERFNSPLSDSGSVGRLYDLVGGHPYLTHRALSGLSSGEIDWPLLENAGERADGPFADHLRRLRRALERDAILSESVRAVLRGRANDIPPDAFHRLRSSGVLVGEIAAQARFRCRLYARFLGQVFTA